MDAQAYELAKSITVPESRILIGLGGIPASGKTSLGKLIVRHINELHGEEIAIVVGLDGWHLTRAQLSAMDDPILAHARRGIHWTFDPVSYKTFVQRLRSPTSAIVTAPSFDHAVKDPVPDTISVLPTHRVVIIEGLYVLLNIDGWREAAQMLDERWFVDVDITRARTRLAKRHVESGICGTEAEAQKRADENDIPNGVFMMENMLEPTKRIVSIEDASL